MSEKLTLTDYAMRLGMGGIVLTGGAMLFGEQIKDWFAETLGFDPSCFGSASDPTKCLERGVSQTSGGTGNSVSETINMITGLPDRVASEVHSANEMVNGAQQGFDGLSHVLIDFYSRINIDVNPDFVIPITAGAIAAFLVVVALYQNAKYKRQVNTFKGSAEWDKN